jgi:hypothetical protein
MHSKVLYIAAVGILMSAQFQLSRNAERVRKQRYINLESHISYQVSRVTHN